jgi:hypothetical protein
MMNWLGSTSRFTMNIPALELFDLVLRLCLSFRLCVLNLKSAFRCLYYLIYTISYHCSLYVISYKTPFYTIQLIRFCKSCCHYIIYV